MLEVAVRILAVVALVEAVVLLDEGGDPELHLSSASVEAELYLSRGEDGEPVVSKKLHDPYEEKEVYMIKRLNAMGRSGVKPSDGRARKPWKNIIEKLSDVNPSFEESDHVNAPLRIIVNDDVEQSEDPNENSDTKSIQEQMEIAQKWFPILLRRAIGNMLNNNTKKELNELVEQLTFRTWKSEDFNGSEQKFVDWMLTVPFHARKRESEEDRLLQKRSSCCTYCNQGTSCQPCIVNIFNNSQIGYVMLSPDGKLPSGCGDCSSPHPLNFSIVLPKPVGSCCQPNAINVEYIPNCENPPVVTECTTTTTTECPTTEYTTEAKCDDSLPYIQYEVSTPSPYKYDFTAAPYKPPPPPPPPTFYESPPCPCHKDKDSHPKPIYPWYNYPEPEYRPKNHNYGASFEDRYEPYNNLPFDIPSAEISDCSQDMDYSTNYHVKRDPQYMEKKDWIYKPPAVQQTSKPSKSGNLDDARLILDLSPTFQSQEELVPAPNPNLRNTLAKMKLSLNDRPVVAKALGSARYNRERPFPPSRNQRSAVVLKKGSRKGIFN